MYKYYIFVKHNNMKKIFHNKYIILIPILFLNIISLFYLKNTDYFIKQLSFTIISYIILIILSNINYKFIIKYLKIFYIITIILLLLVLIIGKEINGSKAWLHILGISIQPSEICKIALIPYLAYLTSKQKNILLIFFLTIIPSILTFIEPDTGAIIIYLIIFLSELKYLKINKKIIYISLIIITIFISLNIYLYFNNKELLINIYGNKLFYRLDRLISFKNQNNIQNTYSLIAIGSHNEMYIPESHNDFIFASIISKYNFIIFTLIIISYIAIITYYIKYSNKQKNISNILNYSILNMLLFQIFYNIFMNLSLLPIIGIPLPFLSYGGSYLIALFSLIGISINLNKHFNNKV